MSMRKQIRVLNVNGETRVSLRGPWTEEEIRRIAMKYPGAEIYLNGRRLRTSGVEDEERDLSPERMALERFEKKKREKENDR